MEKVLLSAFACDPTEGSEPSYGWNWAVGLAERGFEVHCLTRETSKAGISTVQLPKNLKFSYVRLPFGLERLYSTSQLAQYLYYIIWQWRAYRTAVALHKSIHFDRVHHITFGSLQMGSFMYRLGIPLVFGPAGGGQMAPVAFKEYFGEAWATEGYRNKASRLLLRFNPACKKMLERASTVLVANEETLHLAESHGARNVSLALDVGLPHWFFPEDCSRRAHQQGYLKLLWVGRLMPRKGILLLLEVMKELKEYRGITLTVVGDGVMRDMFLEGVEKHSLGDTVHWKGWVPFNEVRKYYSDHDVFLFTSLRESGGLQLIEAMAFGMPVVALDLHGPGLIVDADRGIKCECGTPDIAVAALKAAVLKLYDNPALINKLSAEASNFAASQAWDKKIDSIVDQYYR